MKNYPIISLSLFAFLAVLLGAYFFQQKNRQLNTDYIQSTRPTLFFHGFGSSANAEKHMTQAALDAGVTKTVINAVVDKNGDVRIEGTIPFGAINPIVQVSFKDNRNPNYHIDAQYTKAVVDKLQATYGITEMNMVGHSMGNMAISFIYWITDKIFLFRDFKSKSQ